MSPVKGQRVFYSKPSRPSNSLDLLIYYQTLFEIQLIKWTKNDYLMQKETIYFMLILKM